jgi:adenylosuccinate lyase
MIGPDATSTLAFMLERAAGLAKGLVVYPARLQQNLDRAGELYFSEAILLALVESGMARQQAYVLVQRNAMRAWGGEGTFRGNLESDPDVSAKLGAQKIAACFDLEHALAHVPAILERALTQV